MQADPVLSFCDSVGTGCSGASNRVRAEYSTEVYRQAVASERCVGATIDMNYYGAHDIARTLLSSEMCVVGCVIAGSECE